MKHDAKRRRYLIRPGFQLRWTLIITLAGTVVAAVFAAGLWFSLDKHAELLGVLNATDEKLKAESQNLLMVLYNLTNPDEESFSPTGWPGRFS